MRAVNAEGPGWRLWFDSDGVCVQLVYDPELRTWSPWPEDAWAEYFLRPGERLTQRETQDFLDAVADARPHTSRLAQAIELARHLLELRRDVQTGLVKPAEDRGVTVEQEIALLYAIEQDLAREDDAKHAEMLARYEAEQAEENRG